MIFKKNQNKIAILGASGTSFFGNGMHFIAISWLVLEITDNPLYVSVLVVLGIIPGFISSPFAGVLADRYNKKTIAILMDILRFLVVLSIPLISIVLHDSLWVLYIATVLITLGSNFFFPAISGIIKTSFPREDYLRILSANSTLIQVGMIGGSGIAGFLIANFSIYHVFYLDAFTYLISALFLIAFRYNDRKEQSFSSKKEKNSIFEDMKIGINYVIKNQKILFLFLIGIVPNGVTHSINSLLSAYTKDILNLGPSAYGILDASFAVGFVMVGIIFSTIKLKLSEWKLLTFGFLLMSFSMFLLSIGYNFLLSIIALTLTGMSIVLTMPPRKSLLMKQVDDKYVGRVESLNWMVFSSIAPIIAVTMSLVSNYTSSKVSFFILSLVLLISSLLNNFYSKKISFRENKAESN